MLNHQAQVLYWNTEIGRHYLGVVHDDGRAALLSAPWANLKRQNRVLLFNDSDSDMRGNANPLNYRGIEKVGAVNGSLLPLDERVVDIVSGRDMENRKMIEGQINRQPLLVVLPNDFARYFSFQS